MVTKNEIELEKINLENTKSRREFWRTVIVSGAAVIIVGAISAWGSVYVAYLQNQGNRDVELIKIDSELVKTFSKDFLSEDLGTRIRAAHLFKSIAPSDPIRVRWTEYHSELFQFYEAILKKGGDPEGDIKDLYKDQKFWERFGGIGCAANNLGGCIADSGLPIIPGNIVDKQDDEQQG